MTQFECDVCIFCKLYHREADPHSEPNKLGGACIRRMLSGAGRLALDFQYFVQYRSSFFEEPCSLDRVAARYVLRAVLLETVR